MIHETHECCGVKYGMDELRTDGAGNLDPKGQYWSFRHYKQVTANNKNQPNWVGCSLEEFTLSKKGFENEQHQS